MSFFRVGVFIVFGVFAVIGVLVFALGGIGGSSSGPTIGAVTIWGTHDNRTMNAIIEELQSQVDTQDVTYVEKDPQTYTTELINALAAGRGPDVFLLPHEQIYQFRDKIRGISFETYSARAFRESFIDGADIYLGRNGIVALPFSVDPLIMYWNRPLLSGAGVAEPPRFWDAFYTYAERVTQRSQTNTLERSAVALGEYENIAHALPILSTLSMQIGGEVTARTDSGHESRLADTEPSLGTSAAEAALRFYTEFSNPVQSVFSWNRAQPEARQAFLAGDLGLYFGFASEFRELRNANPNLDFAVSTVPQSRNGERRVTYGKFTGLAVSRTSDNPTGAVQMAIALSGETAGAALHAQTTQASARRALLTNAPDDPLRSIANESTIMTRAWMNPDPAQTEDIFRDMVNSITTGRASINEAIRAADQRINNLF